MDTSQWAPTGACTLPVVDRPLRVAEFDDLFAQHLVRVERLGPTRLRMALEADSPAPIEGSRDGVPLAESVRDLTDRETRCCSFFTFTLTPLDGQQDPPAAPGLILDITVAADRIDVLESVAGRADAVLAARLAPGALT